MYHTQFRRYPACTGLPGEREVLPGRPAKINRPGVHGVTYSLLIHYLFNLTDLNKEIKLEIS